jgi:hypothetical protein
MPPTPLSPATSAPLISVSIVSHGDGAELRTLLESLASHEPIDRIQLLVTDNLLHDLRDVPADGWHSVIMLRPARPLGFARNHNIAFERASGPYFCVLNPDVIFPGAVLLALTELVERGQGHIVAPIMRDSRGQLQDSFRELPAPIGLIRRRLRRHHPPPLAPAGALLYPDWIAGTFMLMRSAVFAHLKGFDPRYRLYFEDVDLCTRARLQGLSITVDPRLQVLHDSRRSSRRPGVQFLWHVQSALRFFASPGYRLARRMQHRG